MKTACVLGAGGFIGSHMVKRLKEDGYWVRGVDLKYPEFSKSEAHEFIIGDLKVSSFVAEVLYMPSMQPMMLDMDALGNVNLTQKEILDIIQQTGNLYFKPEPESTIIGNRFDLVFQFAADMGGANYIFSGEHDADVMHNSALINLNVAYWASKYKVGKLLYSSSACIYPMQIQETIDNQGLKESEAYPVNPDSEYGYEKIFSERVYDSFRRNYGLNIRIVRFHNIFGEEGTIDFLRAKAPASLCRKVAESAYNDEIEVLGDGLQTRSFLYIDEAIEACMRIMESNYYKPLNVGSDEMISINDFARMIIHISGKDILIKNVPTNVQGVRGRNSDNTLIEEVLNWRPTQSLYDGIKKLYHWVDDKVNKKVNEKVNGII